MMTAKKALETVLCMTEGENMDDSYVFMTQKLAEVTMENKGTTIKSGLVDAAYKVLQLERKITVLKDRMSTLPDHAASAPWHLKLDELEMDRMDAEADFYALWNRRFYTYSREDN